MMLLQNLTYICCEFTLAGGQSINPSKPVHCAANNPSYYPTFVEGMGVGQPCVGEMVVVKDEGGTMLGDVENMKISMFWKFDILGFFCEWNCFGGLIW